MSLNLGSLLAQSARQHAGRTALIWDEERWTYAELDGRVRRFAAALVADGLDARWLLVLLSVGVVSAAAGLWVFRRKQLTF